jgi:pyridoxamine 5'-phosphate oxidase
MSDGDLTDGRHDAGPGLTGGKGIAAAEPFHLFSEWLAEAAEHEPNDPNAMALATVDAAGLPDVRMVLLKGVGSDGFVFYTNLKSRKGQELAANPSAALCFHWKSLRRQVRVRGQVNPVTSAEADAYFATRPRLARIGAWASTQSAVLESRLALEKAVALHTARFAIGEIPRPPHWSGFRIVPVEIEFWRDGAFRLHERTRYTRVGHGWAKEMLYP